MFQMKTTFNGRRLQLSKVKNLSNYWSDLPQFQNRCLSDQTEYYKFLKWRLPPMEDSLKYQKWNILTTTVWIYTWQQSFAYICSLTVSVWLSSAHPSLLLIEMLELIYDYIGGHRVLILWLDIITPWYAWTKVWGGHVVFILLLDIMTLWDAWTKYIYIFFYVCLIYISPKRV